MKTMYLLISLFVISSCVSVRLPNEIKVNVTFPENLSEENISQIIDKIPAAYYNRRGKTRIEVVTSQAAQPKKTQETEIPQYE
jgi:hypothetical protein